MRNLMEVEIAEVEGGLAMSSGALAALLAGAALLYMMGSGAGARDRRENTASA